MLLSVPVNAHYICNANMAKVHVLWGYISENFKIVEVRYVPMY